ncbi:hypothetical protein J40TS1_35780 [Paenibacillus montaniterrae]|uniref:Uncharacterized protein n=1 Tax=Paenibacillus montaniterrae TaxID=429341 RepID=A0A919YVB9_9BACL|nr:hypothetical protein J40TS1_35780 [Paenibacillus montaniterrae]
MDQSLTLASSTINIQAGSRIKVEYYLSVTPTYVNVAEEAFINLSLDLNAAGHDEGTVYASYFHPSGAPFNPLGNGIFAYSYVNIFETNGQAGNVQVSLTGGLPAQYNTNVTSIEIVKVNMVLTEC